MNKEVMGILDSMEYQLEKIINGEYTAEELLKDIKHRKDKEYKKEKENIQDNWKKVLENLLEKYNIIKYRIKKLESKNGREYDDVLSGVDYDKLNVQTSNISDPTAEKSLKISDKKQRNKKQYIQFKIYLNQIEKAVNQLPEKQALIIREKFYIYKDQEVELNVRRGGYYNARRDVDIYTHPDFELGKTKFFEIKKKAYKNLSVIFGILN